jgi:hypothetical protein
MKSLEVKALQDDVGYACPRGFKLRRNPFGKRLDPLWCLPLLSSSAGVGQDNGDQTPTGGVVSHCPESHVLTSSNVLVVLMAQWELGKRYWLFKKIMAMVQGHSGIRSA